MSAPEERPSIFLAAGAGNGVALGLAMRCFLAVELPPDVRTALVQVQEDLRRSEADIKWVERENLHLSLKFLGEVTPPSVALLRAEFERDSPGWPSFSLTYHGVGAFPERGRPRVVWTGVTGGADRLGGLARGVEGVSERIGVPPEGRPFVAHVTLGRVRSARHLESLGHRLDEHRNDSLGGGVVREVVLYRSSLTPRGPIYEALARFPLRSE